MKRALPILRGRGSDSDPPNRFLQLHVEPDPEFASREVERPTRYYVDASRTVLTRNNSPDVPFDWSLNPYRGCEHGCSYCLAPGTPILFGDLTWRPIGSANPGDILVGFDEYPLPGRTRKLRTSRVEAVWWSMKRTVRLVTERTEVVTTAEHRWLQARSFRWSRTRDLSEGRRLRYLQVTRAEEEDDDYRMGYVSGMSLGDATFPGEPGWRSDKLGFPRAYWRLALVDEQPLRKTQRYLRRFGVDVEIRPFTAATRTRKALKKLETRAPGKLAIIHTLLEAERSTRSYKRGFLAGFFDAEGHNGTSHRLSQVDLTVLERVRRYGSSLGLTFAHERPRPGKARTLRLVGSIADRMKFLGICEPAIAKKSNALFGHIPPTTPETILRIEPGPVREVVDIQTSSGTFYAGGLATHNCYARPTHEYLGFSAGLDFESRILVKPAAPALLRSQLARKSWTPVSLAMSGVTDPYQPIERRLGITRGCLEVLEAARHPVTIVTKGHAIERDLDILSSLASHHAVRVTVSVTTLERELQRAMEPRALTPEGRLRVIRSLRDAGVPVGINIAPVIPGLTEHEMPAILEACAGAGAQFAAMFLVRLPGAVESIFVQWLNDYLPDRSEKILNRLRELHGGKLSDPRFGHRMQGAGPYAKQIRELFEVARRRFGLDRAPPQLSTSSFVRPHPPKPEKSSAQLELLLGH